MALWGDVALAAQGARVMPPIAVMCHACAGAGSGAHQKRLPGPPLNGPAWAEVIHPP